MAQGWYYVKDGRQAGPVTKVDLSRLVRSEELGPGDFVWREGMTEWKSVGHVEELLPPEQTFVPAKSPTSQEMTASSLLSSLPPRRPASPPAIQAKWPTKTVCWLKFASEVAARVILGAVLLPVGLALGMVFVLAALGFMFLLLIGLVGMLVINAP